MEKDIDFKEKELEKNFDRGFIAKRFATIRLARNISARQLSLELDQSSQYINQIESGRKMPSMEGLYKFCEYFKISLHEFFNDGYVYIMQYRDLTYYLDKLDTEELNEVITIVKRIARNKK